MVETREEEVVIGGITLKATGEYRSSEDGDSFKLEKVTIDTSDSDEVDISELLKEVEGFDLIESLAYERVYDDGEDEEDEEDDDFDDDDDLEEEFADDPEEI